MSIRTGQVVDEYTRPVPGANVYVFEADGSYAALTSDGAAPLDQPVVTDEYGVYTYYAPDAIYREDILYAGKLRYREIIAIGGVRNDLLGIQASVSAVYGSILAAIAGTDATLGTITVEAANRTILAALDTTLGLSANLLEGARAGSFMVVDYAAHSAEVDADTQQGIFVRSTFDPTKAWMRIFSGDINALWFGLVVGDAGGGNAASNNEAWSALIATMAALAVNAQGVFRGLPKVRFGLGTFEFSQPLDITAGTISLAGQGSGHVNNGASTAATRLKFYNSTGIRIQSPDTSGGTTKDAGTHLTGTKTSIQDLALEGTFAGAEAEYHGIHARATFTRRNVAVYNFAGDGIRIEAETTTTGGNATEWFAENDYVLACRNGIFDVGDNTSGGTNLGGVYNQNRRWGIWAANFLGSTWIGFATAGNGTTSLNDGVSLGASIVSYNGNRYGVISGQEAAAATNPPSGTTADNAYWYFVGAGGPQTGMPTWSNGMLIRAGGALRDDNYSSKNTYIGGYAEQDQGKAQVVQRSLIIGGMLSDWVYQNPGANQGTALIGSDDGYLKVSQSLKVDSGGMGIFIGNPDGNGNRVIQQAFDTAQNPNSFQLRYVGKDVRYDYGFSDAAVYYALTGENTTFQFGTGIAQPYVFAPGRFALPYWTQGAPTDLSRAIAMGEAPPNVGSHAKGEIIFNWAPSVGAPVAWMCTASGTPGTWETLYVMSGPLPAAGWVAWTGARSRDTIEVSTATATQCAQAIAALIDDLKARGIVQ